MQKLNYLLTTLLAAALSCQVAAAETLDFCPSDQEQRAVADYYTNKKPGKPMSAAARTLSMKELRVTANLPKGYAVGTEGSAQKFRDVWASIETWGERTSVMLVLAQNTVHTFAFPSLVPITQPDDGSGIQDVYADDGKGIHAHVARNDVKAIYAARLPGKKGDTRMVSFYDENGELILGVIASDSGKGDPRAIAGFENTWKLIAGMSRACADAIARAVSENSNRTVEDKLRDAARNPEAVLRFAGITESMAVGEVNPGGFWYTRILTELLRDKGKYVGLEHHPDHYSHMPQYAVHLKEFPDVVTNNRDIYGNNAVGTWIPASAGLPVAADSLDVIIAVRAMHNWKRRGFFDKAVSQTWDMLKPGGSFVIVQHRAKENSQEDEKTLFEKGRWKQSELVKALKQRGFELVASSELNANPKDVGGYPMGVWNLPPSLRGDQSERDYKAIGESDRMTLKFKKVAR